MGDCICDQFTAPVLDYQDAVGRLGYYRDIWAKFGRRWVGCINWMPVAKCTILGGAEADLVAIIRLKLTILPHGCLGLNAAFQTFRMVNRRDNKVMNPNTLHVVSL